MQDLNLKIAELLCTRLCHDLTGPIGAVNNGVEFLGDDSADMLSQAVELIGNSARDAVSRLQFYRQAYGRVNTGGEANLEELKHVCSQFFGHGKVRLEWPDIHAGGATISISRNFGRILLNVLLLGAESLIRGGTLSVSLSADENQKTATIRAVGKPIKMEEETLKALAGTLPQSELSPRNVQPYATGLLIREIGAECSHELGEDVFTLRISKSLA
ncbi:MAG: hypothetical protein J0L97_04660 [Alphaproteobacteria bacterium]|nr:hypothetical protein [Alphaproteobacteria bacterium]